MLLEEASEKLLPRSADPAKGPEAFARAAHPTTAFLIPPFPSAMSKYHHLAT